MTDNTSQPDGAQEPWDSARHTAPDARIVTRAQWRDGLPTEILRSMAASVVADALVDAANEDGVVTDFTEAQFSTTHVANVLNAENGEPASPLAYDRFSALALTDAVNTMLHLKLLAVRGEDNTLDYRFTLP